MKIYFAGAIRGGRDYTPSYAELIHHIKTKAAVLTEHVCDSQLAECGEQDRSDRDIFERDLSWLCDADAVIAEVSAPSLGVGYELGRAECSGKPVLCLFDENSPFRLSAMISGNPAMQVVSYSSLESARATVDQFLDALSG